MRSLNLVCAALFIIFILSQEGNAQGWNEIPKPEGATIMKIVKSSDDIIYAATNTFEIYRSNDGGKTWAEINTTGGFISNLRDINISPSGTLFTTAQREGISWTADGGQTWRKNFLQTNPQGGGASPGGVCINSQGTVFAYELNFVWRSNAGLNSFTKLPVEGLFDFINYIGVDQTDNLWLATQSGIFFSSNNGQSWDVRNSGLEGSSIFNFYFESPLIIYAGTSNGVYRTDDRGNSWVLTNSTILTGDIKGNRKGRLYAATNTGIQTSVDNGINWTASNVGLTDISVSTILPIDDNKILCGTFRTGVYLSHDGGASWNRSTSGMILKNIFTFEPFRSEVFASTQIGLYKYGTVGQKWSFTGEALPSMYIEHLMRTADNNLFAAGQTGGGIFKSKDNGASWESAGAGLQGLIINGITDNANNIYAVTEDFENFNSRMYISKSTNEGDSWTTLLNELGFSQSSIGVSRDGDIYVSCIDNNAEPKMISSTNNGTTWNTLELPFGGDVKSITPVPNSNDMYYLGGGNVYRTSNRGASWTQVNTADVENIFCMNVDKNGTMYLGTLEGMYSLSKEGAGWIQNDIDGTLVREIKFDENNKVYVRTNKGLYYFDKTTSIVSLNSIADGFILSQNYPNPFNPSTIINFQIESQSFVSLNVYDITGKMVSSLVNEKKNAGNYSVSFNGSQLSSGIYFYTLTTANNTQTKRMLLVK